MKRSHPGVTTGRPAAHLFVDAVNRYYDSWGDNPKQNIITDTFVYLHEDIGDPSIIISYIRERMRAGVEFSLLDYFASPEAYINQDTWIESQMLVISVPNKKIETPRYGRWDYGPFESELIGEYLAFINLVGL